MNNIILRRRNVFKTLSVDNLPKFVRLNSSYLSLLIPNRHDSRSEDYDYWVASGGWGIGVKMKGSKLYSVSTVNSVDNIELIPINQEEYDENTSIKQFNK